MARAGILYSQVVATANRLAEQGENPTVDKVREALGNTGSKSTIAPLLKRWKAEHEGVVPEAQSGLPAELVAAVRHLYDQAQQDANEQIVAMQAEMSAICAKLEAQLQHVQGISDARKVDIEALQAVLAKQEAAYASLDSAHNNAKIDMARLQADINGMQLRLNDRQEEVKGLQQQLQQTRVQFEHYQEATATSRGEERRHYEHANNLLTADLTQARQQVTARDSTISSQIQQITSLQSTVEQLRSIHTKYEQLQDTHTKLAQHLNTQTALAVELSNRHELTADTLLETQKELAILRNGQPQLLSVIESLKQQITAQNQELQSVRIDKVRLEQQLLLTSPS